MLFILPALLAPAAVVITRGEAAKPPTPPSPRLSTITAAGVAISVSGRDWKATIHERTRVDGLSLTEATRLRRADGAEIILGDPGAAGRLPRDWATPQLAKVADRQALRTPVTGGTGWLFATKQGFLAAICRTEEDACSPLLEQVAAAPGRSLLSAAAHRVVNSSLRRLDRAIATTALDLRAESARKRARAAGSLADRARTAREAIMRPDAGALDQKARARLARALDMLSGAARRCARAAERGDAGAWRSCVAAVQRADERVAGTVSDIRRHRAAVIVDSAMREVAAVRRVGRLPALRPRQAPTAAARQQQPWSPASTPPPPVSHPAPQSGGSTSGSTTGGSGSDPIVVGPEG